MWVSHILARVTYPYCYVMMIEISLKNKCKTYGHSSFLKLKNDLNVSKCQVIIGIKLSINYLLN